MQPEPKVNVLIVDDHPENLLALEAILDSPDYNLVRANSGEEALRCLLNQDFAVILLDVQMPGIDGFETASLIRNRQASQHTPIIFLTAHSKSESLMFRGYSLGAVDYLLKPIEPEILTSKVGVFVDLFKKTEEIKRQARQLKIVNTELRESEERFRSLSACSPVGIFLTDIEGRCTYTNPRFQTICGFSYEESLQEGWLKSIHPEDRIQILADGFAWTLSNSEYSNEFRCLTSEGNLRWIHIRTSPMLSPHGELMGHVGTVEDITARKQAEEARAQVIQEQAARKEAETANRMKDEFLATLSHELRTPLNSVLGWAGLLRTRKFDEATSARALETIERNAKSQLQLIEDILDVSRLIRGKLQLNMRSMNIVPLIETVIESSRPAAEAKKIELETVINSSEELIRGDSYRMQQVIWNLMSNAIKFTPEGGKVQIRLENTGSHVQIKVIDTGIGITREFLPYVFDRFRQADSTTTRSYGGLGLGLAIVRHLVELHGGTVDANSDGEGKGALFIVQLPAVQVTGRPQKATTEEESHPLAKATSCCGKQHCNHNGSMPSPLVGLQILIVDDEADVRELLTTVIEESGAQVTAVDSVSEAIKALEQLQPDVLVSDIGMPSEDGYTLIRKVRTLEAERGGCLPAVALTAYAREEDSTQAIASGFQMHLSKPVDTTKLVMAVANLAGRTLEQSTPP